MKIELRLILGSSWTGHFVGAPTGLRGANEGEGVIRASQGAGGSHSRWASAFPSVRRGWDAGLRDRSWTTQLQAL